MLGSGACIPQGIASHALNVHGQTQRSHSPDRLLGKTSRPPGRNHLGNSRAILFMVLSMAAFSVADALVKFASQAIKPGQFIAVTSAALFVIFFILLRRNGERFFSREALEPAMLVRTISEVIGTTGIVMALTVSPLSTVTVLGQAMPLVVMVGAALFLNETIGWRRWFAAGLGLAGVLLILRPGAATFDPGLLWVILYVLGLGTRDLASRKLPARISTPFAVAWSMLPLVVVGLIMMSFQSGWQPVGGVSAIYLGAFIIMTSGAVALITVAMRIGEVSAVAPFRYTRILFGLLIAVAVFDEDLDAITFLGAALIAGSGLYAFWRERRVQTARPDAYE
ncbi:MAG: DMT family transporter [Rhodobacteraceae bacterium]|nr:MAG: DMT family transporter [Paracoccaceae bacterium]